MLKNTDIQLPTSLIRKADSKSCKVQPLLKRDMEQELIPFLCPDRLQISKGHKEKGNGRVYHHLYLKGKARFCRFFIVVEPLIGELS